VTPETYLIADNLPGKLWILPCADADGLERAVRHFGDLGFDTLVSLLPDDEMADLGVLDEPRHCIDHEIDFISYPIVDFGLPDAAAFAALIHRISTLLRAGHGVGVHCRAGIGRSGMVTAGVLMALGQSSAEAIATVSRARGVSIPDTVEQAGFIAGLAAKLKSGSAGSI
jgi:protein-tyrosine phosphatase